MGHELTDSQYLDFLSKIRETLSKPNFKVYRADSSFPGTFTAHRCYLLLPLSRKRLLTTMEKEFLDQVTTQGLPLIERKLTERDNKLLYLVISGSHAWGLSKPDSDIDLRGIYQSPTKRVLGLHKGKDTIEFKDGLYDVQLYEIEKFLSMLCKHNGNMVNLLWVPQPIFVSDEILNESRTLAGFFLTKKLRFYYRGYAESQRKRAMSERGGKALVYTYREMFSGLYTMYFGSVCHNFLDLWHTAEKKGWYKGSLLGRYYPVTNQEVTDKGWHQFYSEWYTLCEVLDKVVSESFLPDTYDGLEYCNKILLRLRMASSIQWKGLRESILGSSLEPQE